MADQEVQPDVRSLWDDRPLGEQLRINAERAAREAAELAAIGGAVIEKSATTLDIPPAVEDPENVSSHKLNPGESLGELFGTPRTDGDRTVELDDDAYERA